MNQAILNQRQETIENAYISVELNAGAVGGFRDGLLRDLSAQGLACEQASAHTHVSIAYTEGEIEVESVRVVAAQIARQAFQVEVTGFEILEGQTTEYDYLVMTLKSSGDFQNAVDLVNGELSCRHFDGGFKSHVSLLKFRKELPSEMKEQVSRYAHSLNELPEASVGACLCLQGECVCVFNPNREICLQVPFAELDRPALLAA
jgi:hypothetical protein